MSKEDDFVREINEQRYQAVIDDLREVCKKHGVFIAGTCNAEGIDSEITIADVPDLWSPRWRALDADQANKINYAYKDGYEVKWIGEAQWKSIGKVRG
ncbi:MAG: hypothetical protein JKY34_12500 [Kordiimonadaceae bacterium]|nr:hypothetical protein [Kordiimonadaceae bacterium]PCJ37765.1 MAG: hypothetical protein COA75_03320 [Cellvibrionales bacterium]